MLDQPIPSEGPGQSSDVVGYTIVIGVNAPDLATAVRYAHDVALRPKQPDGSVRSFGGIVVEADVKQIKKTDWDHVIQKNAKRIDEEGVYYSTGLVYFGADE